MEETFSIKPCLQFFNRDHDRDQKPHADQSNPAFHFPVKPWLKIFNRTLIENF
jgi:hypothetical protein